MKKTVFIIAISIAMIALNSCTKSCVVCTKGTTTDTLCEIDYVDYSNSKKAYHAAINLAEADNYKCK